MSTTHGKACIRWDKQAPAEDSGCRVNYSGSAAAGLRFEASDGSVVAVDSRTINDLFATLWDDGVERRGARPI